MKKESVWDYPRPPRWENCTRRIQVVFHGVEIADTHHAIRVLETSHPPAYYIPPQDIKMEYLQATTRKTICEWKGIASYYTLKVGERTVENIAWYYPEPTREFEAIRNYVAFYPGKGGCLCSVDGEQATPQPGGFYGGWITDDIEM